MQRVENNGGNENLLVSLRPSLFKAFQYGIAGSCVFRLFPLQTGVVLLKKAKNK
jgi:hypothetical protein